MSGDPAFGGRRGSTPCSSRTGAPGTTRCWRKLLEPAAGLPLYMRQMCALELQFRGESAAATLGVLQRPIAANPAPLFVYYWIDRQLHAGLADAALLELSLHGQLLGLPDRVRLSRSMPLRSRVGTRSCTPAGRPAAGGRG